MGTDIPNTGWAPGDPLHEAPTPDLELDAIETLAAVFGALDAGARARVLRWAQDRYVTNAESEDVR